MDGWIKIHRSILDWEWYSDLNVRVVFFHLLLKANFEDKRWQGALVRRGELVTGRSQLAAEIGISEQQVRTALNKLESTGEITSRATNKYTIVTICNYERYQTAEAPEQPTNQPTDNQRITTTKEIKNIRKKEYINIPPIYPPKDENDFSETDKGFFNQPEVETVNIEFENTPLSTEKEKEKSSAKKEKEPKHKYGEYQNVLLTDSEATKLRDEYGEIIGEIVNNFSELKAMKGYKYKNDYLAICRWGVNAYYEQLKRNHNGNNANSTAAMAERCARIVELGDALASV